MPKSFPATYVVIKVIEMVLNEAVQRLGVSLRQTEDQLTRDMLAGTAAAINCVGGVNGDNPTELTRSDIDDVVKTLLSNDAYTILDHIDGQDKYATAPYKTIGCVKSLLIDLEALIKGNRAQAIIAA